MKPLFANLFGPPGTGKTTVGFTFPPPFTYVRFDRRADAIIASVREQLGDVVSEVGLVRPLLSDAREWAEEALPQVEEALKKALDIGQGTFFVDGGNRWWSAVQDKYLPDLTDPALSEQEKRQLEKRHRLLYGPANTYLGDIMLALENSSLNVVITHHTKPVYNEHGQETDRVRPDYFKRVPYTATLEVYMISDEPQDISSTTMKAQAMALQGQQKQILQPPNFYGYVATCKDDASIVGTMIPNPTFTLLYGMALSALWPGKLWTPPFMKKGSGNANGK
jgi:hypothetical protein